MNKDPFKEYIKESEPTKRDKGYAWHTAIGLQAVDGLVTSEYLVRTAVRNIEGEITFEEANALLQSYYKENPTCVASDRTGRQTRFRQESQHSCPSVPLALHRTNIFLSTEDYLLVSIPMQGASGIIISRKKNGY